MQELQGKPQKAVLTFLVGTFALSSIFYFLIVRTGKLGSGYGTYATGLMWCPGLSAILTSRLRKRKLSLLGWQWGENRFQIRSYFIPLLYAFLAYLIVWIAGWGGFYNTGFVARISNSFGFDGLPNGAAVVFYFLLQGLCGMPFNVAAALGEEIGWRGFLVPELYDKMGYTKTSFVTGGIWAVWHFPVLLFADYNRGTPAWYGLTCFSLMIVSTSFVFTWFRIRSNSVWTAVLLHASHNLFIQTVFTPLTTDTGETNYFIDEFGAVLPAVCIGFAIFFWRKRSELTRTDAAKFHPENRPFD